MKLPRPALALLAVGLAGAALAPAASAAAERGTVLSLNRSAKTVRVVQGTAARTVTVRGRIPKAAHVGSRVAFARRGRVARSLRVLGATSSLHVRGKVVRAGGALRVRLADGGPLRVGNVVVNLVGFEPGQKVDVRVDVTDGGDVNVTIELVDDASCGDTCPVHVEGNVTAIDLDAGTFTVDGGGDGAPVEISATPEQLATLAIGDEVEVAAHTTADDTIVADRIEVGDDDRCDEDRTHRDLFGVVTAVGADGFDLGRPPRDAAPRSGAEEPTTIHVAATPEQLAGLAVGDLVHVVVHRDGDAIVADRVEEIALPPAQIAVVARVIATADGSVTIGRPDGENDGRTLTLTTTAGQLDGIAVDDLVRVRGHRVAPEQWALDAIEKLPPPPPPAPEAERIEGWLASTTETTIVVLREGREVVVQATPEQIAAVAGAVRVRIVAHEDGDLLVADTVVGLPAPSGRLDGTVSAIGETTFTIHRVERDFVFQATTEQLAGLVVGAAVVVEFHVPAPNVFVADAVAPRA